MIGNILADDRSELDRQRGRWFLLLGGLLGGIIVLATALGFWLENWGNHIGGGRGEDAHGIGVGFGVALTVIVIVVAVVIWRAVVLLRRANSAPPRASSSTEHASLPVSQAVAAWTSSALGTKGRGGVVESPPVGAERAATRIEPASPVESGPSVDQRIRASMAIEFIIGSASDVHSLTEVIQTVESAGIVADGLWSAAGPHGDQVHIVARRRADTEARLTNAGLPVLETRDVVLVEFDDRAGAAAEIFRRLSAAGLNVRSAHLSSNSRMVISSDDPAAIIETLT